MPITSHYEPNEPHGAALSDAPVSGDLGAGQPEQTQKPRVWKNRAKLEMHGRLMERSISYIDTWYDNNPGQTMDPAELTRMVQGFIDADVGMFGGVNEDDTQGNAMGWQEENPLNAGAQTAELEIALDGHIGDLEIDHDTQVSDFDLDGEGMDDGSDEDDEVFDDALVNLSQLEEDHGDVDDNAPDELALEIGEAVLSILPGTQQVIGVKDAYVSFLAAKKALENGDLSEAGIEAAFTGLAVLGIIPAAGIPARIVSTIAKKIRKGRRLALSNADKVAKIGRSTNRKWFANWADGIVSGKKMPVGKVARVHKMEPEVRTFLKAKGIEPPHDAIAISDNKLARMVRPLKKNKGIEIPPEALKDMPSIFANKHAVLWDKRNEKLIYVFDVAGDPRKGKFTVAVDVMADRGPASKARKRTNRVISGGMVDAKTLKQTEQFEQILGKL